jgi:aspartyl-tRNA(Asn)/glutamyl-tRNA(Gln) amidotransferase subunit A
MIGVMEIAARVRSGRESACSLVQTALAAVSSDKNQAVTRILSDRSRRVAARIDREVAAGRDPGPLAGVPFGVKDLFDIKGVVTTAGSTLYARSAPAESDADAVQVLEEAGAIAVATLNMDEFAYGFATINAHYGTTKNPYDPSCLAGGSSGGSAAAVASGALPFSLGSDTNGSIRVPASLTGLYGLKPTHGGLPIGGVFPFAHSFDDVGAFARSIGDLDLIWGVLADHRKPSHGRTARIGQLGGRFLENLEADQIAAMSVISPDAPIVELPNMPVARSAAFVITAYEGGNLHRDASARSPMAFDPQVRDRLLAGALIPSSLYDEAHAIRRRLCETVDALIAEFDVLLAPATPTYAPSIRDPFIFIDGARSPARADLGIHTQPISFLGLPSLSIPIYRPGRLPLGLQLVGRRGGEASLLGFAATLEERGLIGWTAPDPSMSRSRDRAVS